jgi:hypothetical protein
VQIYVAKNGQRLGPLTIMDVKERLGDGTLTDQDMAWRDGLQAWVPLSQIMGESVAPPPMPAAAVGRGVAPIGMRILTAVVIFGLSFIVVFIVVAFLGFAVGGAISGAQTAAAQNAQGFAAGEVIGRDAGHKFVQTYGALVAGCAALFSLLFSLVLAGLLSFSNLFPWCRRR